ncbi:endonuclease MutS2 [Candidatus Syntrophocurvum alkaliphilum]|nr:endonuclease MutS2 [Candidatus Syntrophocurvum alkaliphilum]
MDKLEFDKIQKQLADNAYSEGGQYKALNVMPSKDIEEVSYFLEQTSEAMELLRFNKPDFLSSLSNVEVQLKKASAHGVLNPIEIYDIYNLLRCSRLTKNYVSESKLLNELGVNLTDNKELETLIKQKVDKEGFLRDDASSDLKKIRSQVNTLRIRIKDYLQSFVRSGNNSKILQDNVVTERDGRYVIPIKQEYRNSVKGIVHDESASGATVFIEPMPVVDLNNKIRSLENEEKREIEKILRELSYKITIVAEELIINSEILSNLDLIFARANLAYKMKAFKPEINNQGIMEINKARHPLLGDEAVPVNIKLGREFDVLVITGPNTGGKTVVLKTIGLLSLMAMSGIFIPAREDSTLSVFDSIYVDIGDEQSIEQSLSTFSSHLTNIIDILNSANKKSLVLLDELGAGTDPVEGAALARTILEELKHIGSKVVVTSHQSELKSYAYQVERVENACVEFDPISLQPTYELTIGTPGQSNAFEIAARLGLKKDMVERSKNLVPEQRLEVSNMIKQLKKSRYDYESKKEKLRILENELSIEKKKLEEEKHRYNTEKEQILNKTYNEANNYLRKIRKEADEAVEELKITLKQSKQDSDLKWHEIEEQRQKVKNLKVNDNNDIEDSKPQKIIPGDYVLVKTINQKGYVLNEPNSQGEVVVQLGVLKLNVGQEQIKKIESPEEKKANQRNQVYLDKVKHISIELDLRGKQAEDALVELEKYLEDANLAGLDNVRIIHGKGTGALRTAVQKYLKTNRYVSQYRDGLREEGGHGVTVVELK